MFHLFESETAWAIVGLKKKEKNTFHYVHLKN